ncbi:hypothetical protein SEA_NICEHOUSE_274 [Rhodococcus phage NiceHouse]|nr:hypothetical protein SEA_NICEHOUSE_274 [Rhodococcus phage NiceHouse]
MFGEAKPNPVFRGVCNALTIMLAIAFLIGMVYIQLC